VSWVRRAVRVAAVALGSVLLLAALAAWRLSRGPIALDFLAPRLGAALSAGRQVRVDVGGAALAWNAAARRPRLEATNVRITAPDGEPLATFPLLRVGLDPRALLRGALVARRIVLLRPRLRIAIRPDGGLAVGVASEAPASGDRDVTAALATLPPGLEVHVAGAEFLLVDQASGESVRAAGVDVRFAREAEGLSARLAGDAVLDGRVVPLRLGARYAPDGGRGEVALAFRRLDPALVGGVLSRVATARDTRWLLDLAGVLARLEMPLHGRITAALEGSRLAGGRVRLRGASGTLALPEVHPDRLAVARLGLVAESSAPADSLAIRALTVDLGGPRVRLTGRTRGNAIDVRVAVRHLATGSLARYWPPQAGAGARRWVTGNISGGQVRSANVHLAGTLATSPSPRFVADTVRGSLDFHGLTVRYLSSMPPATGVAGRGTFEGKRWVLHATRGALGTLAVERARVRIPGPDLASQVDVEAEVGGPLAEALAILRTGRLGGVEALPIDPASVSGSGATEIFVRVPRGGKPAQVRATSRMEAVSVAYLFRGKTLHDGAFTLALDARELGITGNGKLEGVPFSLKWNEPRTPELRRRVVEVSSRVDTAGRAALGFDLSPSVDGPIALSVRYDGNAGRPAAVDVRADLRDTTLRLPLRALVKDPGVPGEVRSRLEIRGTNVSAVNDLRVEVGDSRVNGRATRSADGGVWRTIEAEGLLASPGGRASTFRLKAESAEAGHRFRLTSDDAGAFLEQIVARPYTKGGRLTFAGTADLAGEGQPVNAHLDVRDITVMRAPVLARLTTLASLRGIRDALESDGVRFRRVEAGIQHRDPTITFVDGLARAASLGIAVRGTIDRRAATCDLSGTFVPSYGGLNTAPSRIPVVGKLATGRDEAGIHAVDFRVTGRLANPDVSVDPISALTPGALRGLGNRLRQ
jgi:uncharacterized protein YhdP